MESREREKEKERVYVRPSEHMCDREKMREGREGRTKLLVEAGCECRECRQRF
jgi:hypothetical protein